MDFSKRSVKKKLRMIKSESVHFSTKTKVFSIRIVLTIVVAIIVLGVFAFAGALKGIIDSTPTFDINKVIPSGYATRIYYEDGELAESLIAAGGNREYVHYEEIPKVIQDAFIAVEDERFWEHDGIDVRSIFRAAVEYLTTGHLQTGASTITQQLLKNQVFGGGNEKKEVSKAIRKIQEQYLAIRVENSLSKETILEYYLNTINLGQGAYGIKKAAEIYFEKPLDELTLSEAAVLACIPKSPRNMNPINYPDENSSRRQFVLKKMLEQELISQYEYDLAMDDTQFVYARIKDVASHNMSSTYYSYFTDEVISHLMIDLQEQCGYSASEASNLIFSGGLSVYTTQNQHIQDICDSIIIDESFFPAFGSGSYYDLYYAISIQKKNGQTIHYHLSDLIKHYNSFSNEPSVSVKITTSGYSLMYYDKDLMDKLIEDFKASIIEEGDKILLETRDDNIEPQVSLSIIDQSTGAIIAILGGRGKKTANRTFDRATSSLRQTGSTFKVLAAYVGAIDSGKYTLATPIDDSPYFYPGTTKEVQNWYSSKNNPVFKGLSPVRKAISYSMNILAVKTMEDMTPEFGYNYLKKLGFTTLVDRRVGSDGKVYTDIGISTALGGLTDGVSNLELCAAYATIANSGVYNKPYFYTKVCDHDGNVIISHQPEPRQVMKSSTAFLLTSAMQDTLDPYLGTTTLPAFRNYKMPIAGKTGTTTSSVDKWFVGYTPYYTCAIWTGFDTNYEVNASYHLTIWRQIMERVHDELDLPYKEFEKPSSIVTAKICTKSGKLAVDGLCDHYSGGNCVREEYFAIGTQPTEYCDMHVSVKICPYSNGLATKDCPGAYERVLLAKTEPEIWYPTISDPTIFKPLYQEQTTDFYEWLKILEANGYTGSKNDPADEPTYEPKEQYFYTTSDTPYLVPDICRYHR